LRFCPSSSTLFPYTTLFRSSGDARGDVADRRRGILHPIRLRFARRWIDFERRNLAAQPARGQLAIVFLAPARPPERLDEELHPRSEEHTSELQSRGHLVCRL